LWQVLELKATTYEIGVHLLSHKIVWLNGPIPASYHDLTIAKSELVNRLGQGETVWADKGYSGQVFNTPYWDPLSDAQREWNNFHSALHFTQIERVNGRLKRWRSLSIPFRGKDYYEHGAMFLAIAKLFNLESSGHPLTESDTCHFGLHF